MALNKIRIIEHVDDSFVAHENWIDPKSDREFLKQSFLEMLEFLFTLYDASKLLAVILVKLRAAHDIILELVVTFFIADLLAILDSTLPILISLLPLPLFISLLFPDFFATCSAVKLLLAFAKVGRSTLILLATALVSFRFHSP